MKRVGAIVGVVLVVTGAVWLLVLPRLNSPKRAIIDPAMEPSTPEVPGSPASSIPSGAVVPASPAEVQTALETVKFSIRDYRAAVGGNPVGNNAEITKALGPKYLRDAPVNSQGELIDAWGTPYFFHALSAREMEIHSAGPDRQMWTADDIVMR
jgi:hypothetical protein